MPVRGGEKFQAALADMARKLDRKLVLRVGFMEGATYPDGTSVPMVAALNEYGAPSRGQPPRPFMRNMVDQNKGQWPRLVAHWLKQTDLDAVKALENAGETLKEQMVQSILDFSDPPLAPSTIKKKGFDTPLVHHDVKKRSVTAVVTEDED